MNGRVSKASTRRCRVRLSKALQETLLDAVAELSQSHREPSPDATPVQAGKRRLDAPESDPSPVKRARLRRTDTQQPGAEDERVEQTALQQPKPNPPQRLYASFLEEFVDPVQYSPRSASVDTFVAEWLESVGSDRAKRCRSDSHLHHSEDDLVPRQLTRSAPEMGHPRDKDGFAVPPTPTSSVSRSYRASTEDSASTASGVRHPSYRRNNLCSNNVDVRHANTRLPEHISSHVAILRAERQSPGPSSPEIGSYLDRLETLQRGCTEADVEELLTDTVFPKNADPTYGRPAGLETSKSALMANHLVPNNSESPFRISQPKPDLLYGYSGDRGDGAFTQSQLLAQTSLHPQNPRFAEATANGLRFPFFAIEFKAAGGTGGDLWVATNQCAGASSACLNAIDQLNTSLQEDQSVQRVDNLSYCIAVDNNTAQLYISWKEDNLNYYLQRVGAFLLSEPEHFKSFRKQVRNILDWGKGTRLTQIRNALDVVLEENRKMSAQRAKTRQPPSDGSVSGRGKKPKSSSSSRSGSRSNSVQGQNGGVGKLGEWDERTLRNSTSGSMSSFGHDDSYSLHGSAKDRVDLDTSRAAAGSFMQVANSTASIEHQPTAALDDYRTWSERCKRYYHLNNDGSREWY